MRLLRLLVTALLVLLLCLAGCQAQQQAASSQPESVVSSPVETPSPASTPFMSSQEGNSLESPIQTGVTPEAGAGRGDRGDPLHLLPAGEL